MTYWIPPIDGNYPDEKTIQVIGRLLDVRKDKVCHYGEVGNIDYGRLFFSVLPLLAAGSRAWAVSMDLAKQMQGMKFTINMQFRSPGVAVDVAHDHRLFGLGHFNVLFLHLPFNAAEVTRTLHVWWPKLRRESPLAGHVTHPGLLLGNPALPLYVQTVRAFAEEMNCELFEGEDVWWVEKWFKSKDVPEVRPVPQPWQENDKTEWDLVEPDYTI